MFQSSQGNFIAGKIPKDIQFEVKDVWNEFLQIIPKDKKNDMTYHIWFQNMPSSLKKRIENVENNSFWKKLFKEAAEIENIQPMDELYYSKTPIFKNRGILYGATGNYDLHVDGIFHFPGVEFYRVLIGLTDGNRDVETIFPILNVRKYMNKNDFIVFDFDKAQHQVINNSTVENTNYRIILKLHFCVFKKKVHPLYRNFVSQSYILYEKLTRYFMQTGTNPTSFYEFFIGLLCYITVKFPYLVYFFMFLVFYYLVRRCSHQKHIQQIGILIVFIFFLYSFVVLCFWMRYKIFHIR